MCTIYLINVILFHKEVKMTKFILVRHANPDYTLSKKEGYSKDMAKLSNIGIEQAQKLSKDNIFKEADILLSSPFMRAKETAIYISLENKMPIYIENDLRRSKISLELFTSRKFALNTLNQYLNYSKVIVVTHAEIIFLLTGKWLHQGQYMIWEYIGK